MRGDDQQSGWMFSYVSLEARVPADHPLRAMRQMTDAVLARLSPRFARFIGYRPALDSAGEIAAGVVAAGPVHGSQ